ncbi:DUF4192 domain-containing protein [Rhodococcus qingshengii]|uniref:DUF4192 domain-containing protein n=1 Tax=Rhodococcus qingshengii TaxID=334542 RepID=UPI0027DCD955|nr:DUF4192 domain-containing protein [Rhodococcus qingshengii]
MLEHVRRVEAGAHRPDPQECADLVVALTDVRVRDVVLGLAITSVAAHAEQLWLVLTHEVPLPERAWPATLLGFFAYVRGDGPLAGVALSAALSADSEHTLAGLLDLSLQSGMRPDGSVTSRPSDCPSGNRSESPACRRHCRMEASEQRVSGRPDPGGTAMRRRR